MTELQRKALKAECDKITSGARLLGKLIAKFRKNHSIQVIVRFKDRIEAKTGEPLEEVQFWADPRWFL